MSSPLYELNSLSLRYGRLEALRVNALALNQGSRYSVIGGNGSGKTTLLHSLAGLHAPADGRIRFDGKDLYSDGKTLNNFRRRITCVFQKPVLFRGTVFENVAYPLIIRGVEKSAVRDKVKSALGRIGLANFEYRRSRALSGGEQQRLAIARSLVFEPDVILVDEPTASVDLAYQHVVMSLLSEFSKTGGKTVVFSTHDMELADEYSDERIILDRGRVVSAYPENLFVADIVSGEGNLFAVLPGGFRIPLPQMETQTRSLRLQINPASIKVSRSPEAKGKIIKIGTLREQVRLTVDIGAPLIVLLNAQEYDEMDLRVGERVDVSIPHGTVQVAEP